MLDFSSLKRQIDQMALGARSQKEDRFRRIDLALSEMHKWEDRWLELGARVDRSRTSWLIARPKGPLSQTQSAPSRPEQLTVIAADGSQIFPDRHEGGNCYLINIGYVVIHYGTGERPALASEPFLFHREEDLYTEWAGRKTLITRDMVGINRNAMEMDRVVSLSERAREEGRNVVGLTDGTLILWMLESKPLDFRRETLQSALRGFERLRKAQVPIAGYISNPGSADVVNALRIGLCPERPPDCDRCPWKSAAPDRTSRLNLFVNAEAAQPCGSIAGVTDANLFSRTLRKGERSGLFRGASKILDDYGPHRIWFFYVHTGWEIGRVEVPEWVVQNPELLNRVHATVCDQVQKGRGYPVVLSESHERAVVRGAERERFYGFLREAFVSNELKAERSLKQLKKMAMAV